MKYSILYLIIIFTLCLGCNKKNNHFLKEKKITSNQLTIIFQKNGDSIKSLNLNPSNVKYSEYNDFRNIYIYPDKNKIDTINISLKSDKICLSHGFGLGNNYFYEFYKGDTVIFNYINGIPIAKVTNRKNLEYDMNFEYKSGLVKPLEDYQYFSINKKQRSKNEKEKNRKDLKFFFSEIDKFLDSIFAKNLISENIYLIHKNRFKFYSYNIGLGKIENPEKLLNEDFIHLSTYRFFLEKFTLNKYVKINKISSINIVFDSILKSKIFKGKTKSFLLYKYINVIGNRVNGEKFNAQFDKYKNFVTDTSIINLVRNKYLVEFSSLKKETENVYFINNEKFKSTLQGIVKKNEGKLIYIDFWASWCGPCRAAMPASKELSKDYKNKNVVFIYASIDKDFYKWKKASEDEGLSFYKNNILAVNYPNANFYNELDLKTIPRYILYDKKGKLIHQNAPRPEGEEIRKLFDKYLDE